MSGPMTPDDQRKLRALFEKLSSEQLVRERARTDGRTLYSLRLELRTYGRGPFIESLIERWSRYNFGLGDLQKRHARLTEGGSR